MLIEFSIVFDFGFRDEGFEFSIIFDFGIRNHHDVLHQAHPCVRGQPRGGLCGMVAVTPDAMPLPAGYKNDIRPRYRIRMRVPVRNVEGYR